MAECLNDAEKLENYRAENVGSVSWPHVRWYLLLSGEVLVVTVVYVLVSDSLII